MVPYPVIFGQMACSLIMDFDPWAVRFFAFKQKNSAALFAALPQNNITSQLISLIFRPAHFPSVEEDVVASFTELGVSSEEVVDALIVSGNFSASVKLVASMPYAH